MSTPTLSDPVVAPRRGRSFKLVMAVAVGLLVLAALIAALAYYRFLRYERVAAYHVPPAAAWAVRLDVERVVLFEPVRKHLLPLVNRLGGPRVTVPGESRSADLLAALRQELGLNLGMDLREIVVSGGPSPAEWVLVLGGIFPRRDDLLVRVSETLLRETGLTTHVARDSLLLFDAGRLALAQAEDGSLILGSSASLVELALPPGRRFEAIGLTADEGVGGFGVLPSTVVTGLTGFDALGATVASVERIHGALTAEPGGRVAVRIELSQRGAAEPFAGQIRAMLASLPALLAFVSPSEVAGERALLSRAEVNVTPRNTVEVASYWESSEIDRACAALSSWLGPKLNAAR